MGRCDFLSWLEGVVVSGTEKMNNLMRNYTNLL